jgi:hypothetical protein
MTMLPRPSLLSILALALACPLQAQERPARQPGDQQPSPWYLERGTHLRTPRPADDIPKVMQGLVKLMRDDQVPGFYDGQFASVAHDFEGLARLSRDESVDHTLRMMAIMALQEASDGEALAAQLLPLLLSEDEEFNYEINDWWDNGSSVDVDYVRDVLRADLSRHVRFALAKDGQPEAVLKKIAVMKQYVWDDRFSILDPGIRSDRNFPVGHKRSIWFDIAYHYQQFDDYASASYWFREMTNCLSGDETRWAHYNLACIAAIQGDPDEALAELEAAHTAGFYDVTWMQEDGDLEGLRALPGFLDLARRMGAEDPESGSNSDTETSSGADGQSSKTP